MEKKAEQCDPSGVFRRDAKTPHRSMPSSTLAFNYITGKLLYSQEKNSKQGREKRTKKTDQSET